MAYWQKRQGARLYLNAEYDSDRAWPIARLSHIDPDKVVFTSEYTGGGFGSKITGAISQLFRACSRRSATRPVHLRLTR